MRQMLNGSGADTTATVQAALMAGSQFAQANLYLIGEYQDDFSIWLTDWDSPLDWPLWGTFKPGVINRTKINSKIGLEVTTTDVLWRPANNVITQSNATASQLQLAIQGFYDNWRLRIWRTIMPNPGDANTWGAYELFGGYISDTTIDRSGIKFSSNSLLYVINEKIPTNVIQLTSTLSSYTGGSPPKGISTIPQFSVKAGSTASSLILQTLSPTPGQLFSNNLFYDGFVVFNGGAGSTLEGAWAIIRTNGLDITNTYNEVYLYNPLPWAPTPGVDTCFISGSAPINQADGDYFGFPYVPQPQTALRG